MINKLRVLKIFNRLGVWTIPVVSVISFLPLVLAYWLPSNSQSATSEKLLSPSLSQIPSPPQPWNEELITQDPIISNSATIKTPPSKPQSNLTPQTPAKVPQPPSELAKQGHTPTVSQKSAKAPQQPAKVTKRNSKPILPAPPHYAAPKLEIKVAILNNVASTAIGTSNQASILDANGKMLQTFPVNQGLLLQANGSSLNLGNWQLPGVIWIQPQEGGLVYVGDRWYRGRLLLVSQGSTLLAVNYVDLEHYLYSVVGSEMHPTAPLEALKAQAIAARSYALVHMIRPASSWYNLGATQRWQAYKGLEKEHNTTQKAVDETAGQILSHQGGVVESLYAATDDIVSRVHKGRGMSQTGAYELASEGYDYQQILNRYYPGVSLARLVLQQ